MKLNKRRKQMAIDENENRKRPGKRTFNNVREAFEQLENRFELYQDHFDQIFADSFALELLPAEIDYLCRFFDLEPKRLLVFFVVMKATLKGRSQDLEDITGKLSLQTMAAFELIPICEDLTLRNLFDCEGRRESIGRGNFRVNNKALRAIVNNSASDLPKEVSLNTWNKLAPELRFELRDNSRNDNSPRETWDSLEYLRFVSKSFAFWQALENYEVEERILLLILLRDFFYNSNVCLPTEPVNDILWTGDSKLYKGDLANQIREFQSYKEGLFVFVEDELKESDEDHFVLALTEKGKTWFFNDEKVKTFSETRTGGLKLTQPNTIKACNLYYDKEIEAEIDTLERVLKPEQLETFFRKMEARNLPQCIAMLFSGGPGTGKTETALQLARKTGRALMRVDLSTIKDKFVGESEKNVKAIFREYESAVKNSDLAPILLLNEADGLLTKRREIYSSVDQMNNTMQNILLEQMETIKGVIIATTNLREHLDKAFDRRFNFKLKFPEPGPEARLKIWETLLPEAQTEWLHKLASKHALSGGQIRNVAYRFLVEESLGNVVSFEMLNKLAASEDSSRSTIGFEV